MARNGLVISLKRLLIQVENQKVVICMNKVMFFAHLRDAVGEESISFDLGGKTIAEVKALINEKYPQLKLDTVMTAVNEEFAGNDEVINDGDIIAFIPPVSGG